MSTFKKRSKSSLLLELFLDTSLLLLFIAQAFILGCLIIYGYIPLPREWSSKLIDSHLPPGVRFEAETIRLKLNGDLEFSKVAIWTGNIRQSVLESDGVVAHVLLDAANNYTPYIEGVVVSNGTLYLPAVYSPDGLRRPILERVAFSMTPTDGFIQIDSFAALHQNIRLRGAIEWPISTTSSETTSQTDIGQFYKYASEAIKQRERFNIFTTPTLAFNLTAQQDGTVKITTRISSRELKHPLANGQNFMVDASFLIKDSQYVAEESLRVKAKQFNLPKHAVTAQNLDAIIAPEDWKTLLEGKFPAVDVFARELSIHGIKLIAPVMKVDLSDYPTIQLGGATSGLKGAVTFNAEIDTTKQLGNVQAKGSVDLLSLVPEELAKTLPTLSFSEAPYYDLSLDFAEGFTLSSATLSAKTAGLGVGNILFDTVNAQASFRNGVYKLEEVYVRRDKQWVDLTFSLDSNTWDYKVSLIGSAIPYDYNDLLPSWWGSIFVDFDFSEVQQNKGDFIIYGNAKESACELYFGHAFAEKVRFMDVMVDDATVVVRGRGRYSEVTDIDAKSNGGWATGTIGFVSMPGDLPSPASIRMKFDAQLQLDDAKKLFGTDIAAILDDFEMGQMPLCSLDGAIFNAAYPRYKDSSYFNLTADSMGPIQFKGIPLDHLKFDLYGRKQSTYLRDVKFGYADGIGNSMIDILTPKDSPAQLRYLIQLENAKQALAIQRLPQLATLRTDLAAKDKPAAEIEAREEGYIDINLHASGPVDDPFQHNGYGDFTLRNKQLGAIQLLGPLSRLLKDTPLSFTSFNLDTMSGRFQLIEELIQFEQLQIDGARTRISAPGTMTIREQALDMKVSVNLFANVGSPDSTLKKVGDLLKSPLPNLLQFQLTGTLKNQKWRSLYDPRNLIPRF